MTAHFHMAVVTLAAAMTLLLSALPTARAEADAAEDEALSDRFAYLSANGNSNCSPEFEASIPKMSPMQMLQGSCCSPMDKHRYIEQVQGLREYRRVEAIPIDPYDIPAGLAQELMRYYPLVLTRAEQDDYDYAMVNSDEKGPCCCKCWRWKVYGGLANHLIRDHGFTGPQIAKIWDLSDGCGGSADHSH